MPTALRNDPSVPPGCSIGTTGTPGHMALEILSIGPSTDGGNEVGGGGALRVLGMVTATFGSSTSLIRVWRTSSGATPGKMRQLTLAVARCGRALVAWPALSIVATQVVRSMAW